MALTVPPTQSDESDLTPGSADTAGASAAVAESAAATSGRAPQQVQRQRQGPWASRLPAIELLWLLLLGLFVFFPGKVVAAEWQWVVVLLLFLFWPLRLWLLGTLLPPTPVRLAAAVLLLTVPLALLVSVDRALSWEAAGYLLYGPVVAAALVSWPPVRRRPQWIGWLLILGTVGLALAGPLVITDARMGGALLAALQTLSAPLTAALGETINANILANALLVGFPLLLSLALFGGWSRLRGWAQALCALASLLVLVILLLTDSRGAWMAVAVVLPLLLVLRWPTLAYAVPLLVMGVVTVGVLAGPQLLDQLTAGSATSGIAQRVEIWQRGLWLIHSFPASGAGLGTFGRLVPVLYPYDLIPADVYIPDAHNLPIQVGVDLGVAGLVAWLALTQLFGWMAAAAFGRSRRWSIASTLQPPVADAEAAAHRAAQRAHALRSALAAGALASVVAGLVAGIFAATNWGVKPSFLPWLVGALIVLLYAQSEEQAPIAAAPGFSPAQEGAHAEPL